MNNTIVSRVFDFTNYVNAQAALPHMYAYIEQNPSSKKEIFFSFDGELVLPRSMRFFHQDVVLRGLGKDRTKIVIADDFHFDDDCIIGVYGNPQSEDGHERPVSVEISDLTIESRVSRDVYNSTNPTKFVTGGYAVKIYCASKVEIRSVGIQLEDVACTNIDIRKGRNIKISDCTLINYNRQLTGGVLWLRGEIINAIICGNTIRKYGNDEALAIWSVNNYIGVSDNSPEIRKEHILVTGNKFYNEVVPYVPPGIDFHDTESSVENVGHDGVTDVISTGIIDSWDGIIDRYFVIFTNQDDNRGWGTEAGSTVFNTTPVKHIVRDVHIDGNDFYMNAPVENTMTFAFDRFTDYEDVSFSDNRIEFSNWSPTYNQSGFHGVLDVNVLYDVHYGAGNPLEEAHSYSGYCNNPVEVCRNLFKSDCHAIAYEDTEFHTCLNTEGAKVLFADNTIDYSYRNYQYPTDLAKAGYIMLYGSSKSFRVVANGNRATGLQLLMSAASSNDNNPIEYVSLEANGNHLEGDTRIFTRNVLSATYNCCGNYIKSDYELFFLAEQAKYQTVTFKNNFVERNLVNTERDKGFIYYVGNNGVGYNRCLMTITDNVFDFANSIDPEDAGNMYSWFTQMGGYTLYQKGNKKSQES